MTSFISLMAALNGSEVVISTPAAFRRSMGYLEEPEESIWMYASRVFDVLSARMLAAIWEEAVMLVAY